MTTVVQAANVGGIPVQAFASQAECARNILDDARHARGGFAVAINAEKVVTCLRDRAMSDIVRHATLRYPDGAGVVVAMRMKGFQSARVAGADLWLEILEQARDQRVSAALIGASPEVLAATRARLAREFPNLDVRLAADGFAGARDAASVAQRLIATRPELIFVAMGSPRQEALITELRRHHPQGFYLGLGGSFDIYSGAKRRAPRWMQQAGLEWLFRFLCEPSRARRETKRLKFLFMLAAGRL